MYALTSTDLIQRDDGALIPPDPSNIDYASYLRWVAAGNTPAPYAPPPAPPVMTTEQARAALAGAGFTAAQVDALIAASAALVP